ncbi:hypothetical protein [Marinoscillum furvescens]|uniref:Uncharacterized protein n=1 Tax=Marinoscillum furvescens DSM 4134 TaxID=1122208 RepID=A0A3D9KWI6_MARFU|nr:hypothetical protein [Marinoscillum furvescens]RED91410.1 hypothetical protein C7460_1436 [Marinoscillum furvescens DSM 4134]
MKNWRYITSLGVISVTAGAIYNYFYYKAFDINIFDYVSLSETLVLFDEFLPFILVVLAISWPMPLILDRTAKELSEQSIGEGDGQKFSPYIDKDGFFRRLLQHLKINIKVFLILIVFSPFLFFVDDIKGKEILRLILLLPIMIFVLNYFKYELFDRLSRIHEERFSIRVEVVSHFLVIVIPVFILYCNLSIKRVFWESDKVFQITFNDGRTITSNDSIKYLGKTEKFIFFRDLNSEASLIYSINKIDETSIKKAEPNN